MADGILGSFQRKLALVLVIGIILLSNVQIVTGEDNQRVQLDPLFASYLGGTNLDLVHNMLVDSEGYIILAGVTQSTNYPVVNANQSTPGGGGDGFITKISPDGQEIIFSTYLGGSDLEILGSVGIDSDNNIIVVGSTESSDFPTKNPFKDDINGTADIFITKYAGNGTILFSTLFGGDGNEHCKCPRFDSQDNIIMTGHTTSVDFPVSVDAYQKIHAGIDDAFILKMSADGQTIIHSTLLGGNGTDGGNYGFLDENDRYVLCGLTTSPNFPLFNNPFQSTYGGVSDGFITVFDFDDNQLVYSSFYGGDDSDYLWKLSPGNDSSIVIAGYTKSTNFPTTSNALQTTLEGAHDGLIMIFNTSSFTLNYSTLFGGNADDDFRQAIFDSKGNIIIIGTSTSNDYPITSNAYQTTKKQGIDIIITVLDPSCQNLLYSTFYGGDNQDYGNCVSLFNTNELIFAGSTGSSNIPVLNPIQASISLDYDNYFGKFTIDYDPPAPTEPLSFTSSAIYIILLDSCIMLVVLRKRKASRNNSI